MQLDPVDLAWPASDPRGGSDRNGSRLKFLLTLTGKGILFLDELTSAPQMTQAGCYQFVLDRKLGEYALPG